MTYHIVLPITNEEILISTPSINAFKKFINKQDKNAQIIGYIANNLYIYNLIKNTDLFDEIKIWEINKLISFLQKIKLGGWLINKDKACLAIEPNSAFQYSLNTNIPLIYTIAPQFQISIDDPDYVVSIPEELNQLAQQIKQSHEKPIILIGYFTKWPNTQTLAVKYLLPVMENLSKNYDVVFIHYYEETPNEKLQQYVNKWIPSNKLETILAYLLISELCITSCNGLNHFATALDCNLLELHGIYMDRLYRSRIVNLKNNKLLNNLNSKYIVLDKIEMDERGKHGLEYILPFELVKYLQLMEINI